jgi:hypothetical protein
MSLKQYTFNKKKYKNLLLFSSPMIQSIISKKYKLINNHFPNRSRNVDYFIFVLKHNSIFCNFFHDNDTSFINL